MPRLTPEIAEDLMYRSMTTGVPTYELNQYGGYDAVRSMYEGGGGTYNLADIPQTQMRSFADTINRTGVGNQSALNFLERRLQTEDEVEAASPLSLVSPITQQTTQPAAVVKTDVPTVINPEARAISDTGSQATGALTAVNQAATGNVAATGQAPGQQDVTLESQVITEESAGFLPTASGSKAVSPLDYGKMVTDAYTNILKRAADTGGLDYWKSQLESGAITPEQFESVFREVAKPELDVQALYQDVLKREADVGGLAHWTQQIGSGGITPEERERFIQEAINAGELKAPASQTTATTATTATQTTSQTANTEDKFIKAGDKDYDKGVLLGLVQQIIPNITSFSGGVFGENKPSVGFDYETVKTLLKKDPTVGEQVVLDIAKSLMDRGITDLSQLQYKDVYKDVAVIPAFEGPGFMRFVGSDETGTWQLLTPEEAAKVEAVGDNEGGFSYVARNINTGKGLFANDKLLTEGGDFIIGKTYSGPGMTGYQVTVNPETGKYNFSTFGSDTGDSDILSFALQVASFIPPLQPFAAAANAYLSLQNGNIIGALASLSGLTDYTNVTTALNTANAINQGNYTAAITSIMGNPNISGAAGSTMLTDTISLKDVGTAINLVTAASNGNIGAALVSAGNLVNSSDLQLAGQAVNLVNAAQSGNYGALLATVKNIDQIVTNASNNLNNTGVVTNLISNITQSQIANTGETDLGSAVYTAAINSGATEDEALDAANAITSVTATAGGSDKITTSTGNVDADVMNGVTEVDTSDFAGWDDALKNTTERNTLTIGNTDADTLEEATALAANRGFTNFTYGGKTYAISGTSSDLIKNITNAEIAAATNFSDAYSIARNALGAGQIFEWNGKQYSTDSREENPSLAAASDQLRLAQAGIGGGKGTYAGYDTTTAGNYQSQIDLSGLDQAQTYGTFDPFLKSAGLGGEYVIVDDKISKQIIDPVVKTTGVVTRGVGGIVDWTAGTLQAINVIDKNSPLVQIASDLKALGTQQIGEYLINEEKQFISKIANAEGWDKARAVWDAIISHPSALLTLTGSEAVEEAPSLVTATLSIIARAPAVLAYGVNAITNLVEAAGANYNDTKQQALANGMSEADAHAAAQKSAGGAGALAFVLGPLAEMPLIKRAGELAQGVAQTGVKQGVSQVGKTVGKEMVTESVEGGGAAGLGSYFATGKVDMNQVLTSAVLDPLIAGNVSGTIATVVEIGGNKPATTEVIAASTSDPAQATNLINTINATMQPGVDLKQAGNDIVTAMTASGMNTQQAESVANTAIAEQILTNINNHGSLNIPDVNIAIGADKFGNAITLGDFLGSSVTGLGNIEYVAPDIYIGTNAQGQPITVGDLSSLSQISTTSSSTKNTESSTGNQGDVTTSTATDQNTGATTETTSNATTGVNTSTTTNNNTGVTTQLTTDTNTNVNTEVKTDTKTNTETTTTTDNNTNTTTQTTVNNNSNTTTTVTTNSNSQVVSEVVTDNNNNTETTTETDVNNNTQTTTVIDTNTNTVISVSTSDIKDIPTLDPVPTVDPVEETKEEKDKDKKKKDVRRRLPQAAPTVGGMAGAITGIDLQMLKSYVTGEKKIDPLERLREIQQESEAEAMMQNIDPRLAAILQERMGVQPQQEDLSGLGTLARVLTGNTFDMEKAQQAEKDNYYAYGKEDSIDDILGTTQMQSLPYAAGGYVEPLMAQGGMTLPLMAKKGGLPETVDGREDFRHGKHVAGEGDGQSDDIPAMLADGEFVFPADVVSALGNGSTKAGTDKLYEMMHAIRERARSTKNKDLPPPALKSPLDYLKSKR